VLISRSINVLVLNWRLCTSLRPGSKRELHICPKNLQILKVFENYTSTKTITLSCFHALHSLTEVYIADCYAVILRYGELFFRRRTFAFLPTTDTFVIILAIYDCLWARYCILWSPNRQARFLRFTAKVHLSHCVTWATCKQTVSVDNLPTVLTTNGKCILVKQDYRWTSINLFFLNPLFWTSILGKYPVLHLWCDINRIQTFEKCMVQIIFHVCLF